MSVPMRFEGSYGLTEFNREAPMLDEVLGAYWEGLAQMRQDTDGKPVWRLDANKVTDRAVDVGRTTWGREFGATMLYPLGLPLDQGGRSRKPAEDDPLYTLIGGGNGTLRCECIAWQATTGPPSIQVVLGFSDSHDWHDPRSEWTLGRCLLLAEQSFAFAYDFPDPAPDGYSPPTAAHRAARRFELIEGSWDHGVYPY